MKWLLIFLLLVGCMGGDLMGDADTGGGAGPNEDEDYAPDNYSDLAFSYSAPGAVGKSVAPGSAGMDFGAGGSITSSEASDWNAGDNTMADTRTGNEEFALTDNEPKKEPAPVSERVSKLKKKAKRRSLLGGQPSSVYRRSILGSQ